MCLWKVRGEKGSELASDACGRSRWHHQRTHRISESHWTGAASRCQGNALKKKFMNERLPFLSTGAGRSKPKPYVQSLEGTMKRRLHSNRGALSSCAPPTQQLGGSILSSKTPRSPSLLVLTFHSLICQLVDFQVIFTIFNLKHISGRCAKQKFKLHSLREHLVLNLHIPLAIWTSSKSMV